jgi:DnaJ-class molecular chaperone
MRVPSSSSSVHGEIPAVRVIGDEHACEEDAYDDEQDHVRCRDCKGSGWYIGFTERRYCPTCEGSGFL